MTHAPIGIFDSGVGGRTVVRAILEQLPCQHPYARVGGVGTAR